MKINSILKGFLIKYLPAIIFFIVKNFFGLDFLNDFNPFTSETKEFFNGNGSEEGEGSNRQNDPQDSSITPPSEGEGSNRQNDPQDDSINPEEVKEVEGGVIVSGKTLEEAKALYKENSELLEKVETVSDKSVKQDIFDKNREIEERFRILEERKTELKQRIIDYYDLRNQGQSKESLSDIKRQLVEDAKALDEDFTKLINRARNNIEARNKLFLRLMSKGAEKIKDIMNESNSK